MASGFAGSPIGGRGAGGELPEVLDRGEGHHHHPRPANAVGEDPVGARGPEEDLAPLAVPEPEDEAELGRIEPEAAEVGCRRGRLVGEPGDPDVGEVRGHALDLRVGGGPRRHPIPGRHAQRVDLGRAEVDESPVAELGGAHREPVGRPWCQHRDRRLAARAGPAPAILRRAADLDPGEEGVPLAPHLGRDRRLRQVPARRRGGGLVLDEVGRLELAQAPEEAPHRRRVGGEPGRGSGDPPAAVRRLEDESATGAAQLDPPRRLGVEAGEPPVAQARDRALQIRIDGPGRQESDGPPAVEAGVVGVADRIPGAVGRSTLVKVSIDDRSGLRRW